MLIVHLAKMGLSFETLKQKGIHVEKLQLVNSHLNKTRHHALKKVFSSALANHRIIITGCSTVAIYCE